MTPQSRHAQKRDLAVMFLGVFGVSVNALIIRALGIRSASFPRRLVRDGLVAEHRRLGYPNTLFILTRQGHEIAEMLLHRTVRLLRADKLSTSQLAHDLMTQAAVLESLEGMAERSSASLDLEAFLLHARDSRDLGAIDQAVRPDLLFELDGRALSWELENYVKSSKSIFSKMHMLLRSSTQFKSLTVFWAIRSGSETVERYRACWDRTLDQAHELDGISRQELSRVKCIFKSTAPIRGVR
jgi:hypothetical protein